MKIIYHGNCPDGFGAAVVAWEVYGSNIEYLPAYHNVEPPALTNEDILMVDFSYNYEVMLKLAKSNKTLTVIDHHTGMFPVLDKLELEPNVTVYKDKNHSGAVLMWKYLNNNIEVPKLLQFIEDRDCHFNKMEDAPAALMWLDTHSFDFGSWHAFMKFKDHTWEEIIKFNKPMVKKYKSMVYRAANQSVPTRLAGYPAQICFGTEELASDIASEMAHRCDGIGIVGVVQTNGMIKTSLRSVGIDLIPIAQALNGGGHSYAAAFPTSPMQLANMLKGEDLLNVYSNLLELSI